MKKLFLFVCLVALIGCEKNDDSSNYNIHLAGITGKYSGIYVFTNLDNPPPDTSYVTVDVKMGGNPNEIVLYLSASEAYYFEYRDSVFVSTIEYHPPTLSFSHDSLHYFRQPGLGPAYEICECKKVD
ncbi:MAG TPA: hypothetical protein VMC08_07665 [Bacteroidales bacterium]|nr:hypothetical protein [Bacteroidales bacterium]